MSMDLLNGEMMVWVFNGVNDVGYEKFIMMIALEGGTFDVVT